MPENKSEDEKWKQFCELEATKQESCKVSALKDSTPIQSPSVIRIAPRVNE